MNATFQANCSVRVCARGTTAHRNPSGPALHAAEFDFTPTDFIRALALAGMTEPLADTGPPPFGDKFGITDGTIDPVDEARQKFSTAIGAPASARSRRKAMTGELPGQFAAVEEMFAGLDDLVIQYRTSDIGKQFVDAWFNSRHVDDLGRRAAKPAPTPRRRRRDKKPDGAMSDFRRMMRPETEARACHV